MNQERRPQKRRWPQIALASVLLLVGVPLITLAGFLATLWHGSGAPRHDDRIVVYPAAQIVTMDADRPFASTIAIADGRVLAIGARSEVEAVIAGRPHEVDDRFAERVVLPGFIDPHVHASLALMFNLEIVSAMEWQKPSGPTVIVRGRDEFLARI